MTTSAAQRRPPHAYAPALSRQAVIGVLTDLRHTAAGRTRRDRRGVGFGRTLDQAPSTGLAVRRPGCRRRAGKGSHGAAWDAAWRGSPPGDDFPYWLKRGSAAETRGPTTAPSAPDTQESAAPGIEQRSALLTSPQANGLPAELHPIADDGDECQTRAERGPRPSDERPEHASL